MDLLLEEIIGIIIAFAFHILGKSHTYRAGLRRVSQYPHCLLHGGHEMLRTGDPIPELTYRTECIVGGHAGAIALLQLLQYRVRLAHGEGITRQQQ